MEVCMGTRLVLYHKNKTKSFNTTQKENGVLHISLIALLCVCCTDCHVWDVAVLSLLPL